MHFHYVQLESIVIPDSVESLGNWVFFGCSNLKNLTIPAGIKRIEDLGLPEEVNANIISFF